MSEATKKPLKFKRIAQYFLLGIDHFYNKRYTL